jgi:hypothetical protein
MELITPENKEVLLKRTKSLAWRAGMMCVALLVGFLNENLGLLNLPQEAVVVLGLVLGEVSKYLNSKTA